MSCHAFYLPPQDWSPEPCLDRDEAAHAHVLRLKTGDSVLLMDGVGTVAECQIIHMRKKETQLKIVSEKKSPRPAAQAIMAIALSKAVRRSFFMEKAAELGCSEIWLWDAARSQGHLTQAMADACRGQLIAGMKQSLNPWLPELALLPAARAVAEKAADADWRVLPWENQDGIPMLTENMLGRAGRTVYVIGPEGGFTDTEAQYLLENGFAPVSLGRRVLRCETAATLCLGLHWWASQLPGRPDGKNGSD